MTTSDPITLILWSPADDADPVALDNIEQWTRQPDSIVLVAPRKPASASLVDLPLSHMVPGSGETVWHGIARAAGGVGAGLIVFLEATTRPPRDWLTRLANASALPGTGAVGGDLLRDTGGAAVPTSRQRAAISGWYGVSHVSLDNAAITAAILQRCGPLAAELGTMAAAPVCRRMVAETDTVVRFAPEAAVRLASGVTRAWRDGIEVGGDLARWLNHSSDGGAAWVTAPAPALRNRLCRLEQMLSADGTDTRTTLPELADIIWTMATSLGLSAAQAGVPANGGATATPQPRAGDQPCPICGGRTFVAGPRGRMVGTLGPQCGQCGSLERHRVLAEMLASVPDAVARELDVLLIGDDHPRALPRFRSRARVDLARLRNGTQGGSAGIAGACNMFGAATCTDMASTLGAIVSVIAEDGTVVLVERLDTEGATRRRTSGGYGIGLDFGVLVARMLPDVNVAAFMTTDRPTGEPFVVVVASANSGMGTLMASRAQAGLLAALRP